MKNYADGEFDPETISKQEMKDLADAFETFVDFLTDVMIFPEDIPNRVREDIEEGIDRTRDLIKQLRKGNKEKVFKDSDEWNSL